MFNYLAYNANIILYEPIKYLLAGCSLNILKSTCNTNNLKRNGSNISEVLLNTALHLYIILYLKIF